MVDANVWLDLFIPRRPNAEKALAFFKEARKQGAELAFTLEIARAVFRVVSYEAKCWMRETGYGIGPQNGFSETCAGAIAQTAWDAVKSMQEIGTAVGSAMGDLWLAENLRDEHAELEDNLTVAACMRCKANYLVTGDKTLRKHAPVATASPEVMTKLLRAGVEG